MNRFKRKIPIKKPYILWIGVIRKHKRPLLVAEIAKKIPTLNFILIGSTVEEEKDISIKLKELCNAIPNLDWIGPIDEETKEILIEGCTMGLMTSIQEGFGMVPMEFISKNKSIIAYPLPVLKEVYGNSLLYARTVEEYVNLINAVINYPAFRKKLVSKNRKKYQLLQKRYDLRKISSRLNKKIYLQDKGVILILARDLPLTSKIIQGNYIMEWKLWKCLAEFHKNKYYILSTGAKFMKEVSFKPRSNTHVEIREVYKKEMLSEFSDFKASIFDLMSFLITVIRVIKRYQIRTVITSGAYFTILGYLLKLMYPNLLIISIVHDIGFAKIKLNSSESGLLSTIKKIRGELISNVYQAIDMVITVSHTSAKELQKYLKREIKVIWNI